MSLATALLTPILGDASPWGPQRLFQLGEAGGWYDPSDLTAEKVAWRRNLLTWSEDFTNAAWTKSGTGTGSAPVVTANAAVAPDGTPSADLVAFNRGAGNTVSDQSQLVTSGITVAAAVAYTGSVYIKAATAGDVGKQIAFRHVGAAAYQIITLTASYVRIEKAENAFTTSGGFELTSRGTFTADNTVSVHLWGAQLEIGSTATAYQRITDFTSDFLAAFPTHALYQDSAGTTPVTALGQPVGLAIDKSRGGLANVGSEVFVNPDCTSLTGFTAAGTNPPTLAFNNGVQATVTIDDSAARIQTSTITGFVVGRMYMVEVTAINACTKGNLAAASFTWGTIADTNFALGTTTKRIFVTATATSGVCRYYLGNTADNDGNVATITRHSVREVPGVHAIQPTSASRPLLDGRVNLLTFSDQIAGGTGNWVANSATVTANNGVAPDGTTTASRIVTDGTAINQGIYNSVGATAGTNAIFRVFLRGAVGGEQVSIGDATLRQTVTLTTAWQLYENPAHNLANNNQVIYAVNNTAMTFFVWRADLRLSSDASYPPQRVAAATDYADVGVPRSFLFDGFDDSLYTASNMDLSGTDKVTVLAGVRKLSDAAAQVIAETSANASTNVGTLSVSNFNRAGTVNARYSFASAGTLSPLDIRYAVTPDNYAAPNTAVLTGLGNISGDSAIIRANGVQQDQNTGDQGVTNYGSYVLFIGRRNNASLPFKGKAYQLIVRGALTDTATLAQAERYVEAKTGLYL